MVVNLPLSGHLCESCDSSLPRPAQYRISCFSSKIPVNKGITIEMINSPLHQIRTQSVVKKLHPVTFPFPTRNMEALIMEQANTIVNTFDSRSFPCSFFLFCRQLIFLTFYVSGFKAAWLPFLVF